MSRNRTAHALAQAHAFWTGHMYRSPQICGVSRPGSFYLVVNDDVHDTELQVERNRVIFRLGYTANQPLPLLIHDHRAQFST